MNMRKRMAGLLACSALLVSGVALAADKPVNLTLSAGTESNSDGLYYASLQLLDKALRKETGDQVKLKIYPNSQLGDESDMVEGLRTGSLDISIAGVGNFASFVPEFQLFSVPYLFKDYETYRKGMAPDSELWKRMRQMVEDEDLGITLMAPTTVGSRWVVNRKGEIRSPDDMKALRPRMRVQANPIESEVWSLYGANPVNMPMPEVASAMRQGVVDAVENAPDILYTYKVHEVAKYISKTNHSFYVALILASDRALDKVPASLRPAVEKAFETAGQQTLDLSIDFQKKAVAGMQADGALISDVDVDAFREPVIPLYDRVAKEVGAEGLLEAINGL